jgi:hypothetical protein
MLSSAALNGGTDFEGRAEAGTLTLRRWRWDIKEGWCFLTGQEPLLRIMQCYLQWCDLHCEDTHVDGHSLQCRLGEVDERSWAALADVDGTAGALTRGACIGLAGKDGGSEAAGGIPRKVLSSCVQKCQ